MSGGVDSSVAALRLREQGHDVVGVFLRNGVTGSQAQSKTCCSASDSRDAASVCDRLGIPFYSVDYAAEFGAIMDHFAAEYRRGRTPNPCVLCNQQLKFGHVLQLMTNLEAEAVATGHYARVEDGRMLTARDANKDQTYYLFGIDRTVLDRVLFPLGELDKEEVRGIARAHGMRTADKPESMEICFVTSGDYRDFVRARGGAGKPGRFLDAEGRTVGRHDGVDGFTVGQRRGLPALGVPHYVTAIDAASGDVLLAPREGLQARQAELSGLHWLVDTPRIGERVTAEVKVRARSAPQSADVEVLAEGQARLHFQAPVEAVTPGQAAVFYRGEQVLGGGWID
jgi:tRNA-specific 2-thiouridylase